jgi:hypothetical protein
VGGRQRKDGSNRVPRPTRPRGARLPHTLGSLCFFGMDRLTITTGPLWSCALRPLGQYLFSLETLVVFRDLDLEVYSTFDSSDTRLVGDSVIRPSCDRLNV